MIDVELLKKLTGLLSQNQFDTLKAEAEQALEQQADEAQLWHFLAMAQDAQGDAESAKASLQKAISFAPNNPAYVLLLAHIELKAGNEESAQKHYETARDINPNVLDTHLRLATMALMKGDVDEAQKHIASAKRIDDLHPMVMVIEGNLDFIGGNLKKAAALLNEACKRAPESTMALTSFGMVLAAQGHHAFAAQSFRRALELAPEEASIRWALSDVLFRQSHFAEALDVLQVVAEKQPSPVAWRRAQVALGQQNMDAAQQALNDFLANTEEKNTAVSAGVRLWLDARQPSMARQWLVELEHHHPELDAVKQSRLGLALSLNEELELAESWVSQRSNHVPAQAALATASERCGHFEAAQKMARKVLEQQPENMHMKAMISRYELQNTPEKALVHADQALAGDRGAAIVQGMLSLKAMAHDQLHQYQQAWTTFLEEQLVRQTNQVEAFATPEVPDITSNDSSAEQAIVLYGPPGSRISLVADALAGLPGRKVLLDRFNPQQRLDGFGPVIPDDSQLTEEQRKNLPPLASAARWSACVQAVGFAPDQVLDWWPANPGMIKRLPGARLVAVVSDPRQLLLNWVAFGSPQHIQAGDLDQATAFLNDQLDQLAALQQDNGVQTLMISSKALAEDTENTLKQVMDFCGLTGDVPAARYQSNLKGLGGLPTGFPPGHHRHYAQAAAEAFAKLKHLTD